MLRVHRIGKDALARMEGVGTLARKWLRWLAAWAWLGLRTFPLHQRKIIDGARPGELGVIKRGIVTCGGGQLRERHDDKHEVPQGGSDQSTPGDFALHPTVLEEIGGQKILRDSGPGQHSNEAAADALMERSPGDVELRASSRFEGHRSNRLRGLSQET